MKIHLSYKEVEKFQLEGEKVINKCQLWDDADVGIIW